MSELQARYVALLSDGQIRITFHGNAKRVDVDLPPAHAARLADELMDAIARLDWEARRVREQAKIVRTLDGGH